MNAPPHSPDDSALRATAARWIVRRDRGLSAAESIEFELWLAADLRHPAAMQRAAGTWSRLDRIPESSAAPVLIAATRRRSFWRHSVLIGSLAAAALALVTIRFFPTRDRSPSPITPATEPAKSPRQFTLSDGTVVQLNTNSDVTEQFTAAERRVILARGEAHFAVTKNPARPFVVHAGNVDVRAVGTAFNVNLQSATVEVLVTEGVVELKETVGPALSSRRSEAKADAAVPALSRSSGPSRDERVERNGVPASGSPTTLTANERAVVSLGGASLNSAAVVVTTASADEIARTLAWQAPLLRLGGSTLAELVLEFQRRSGQRVILADPALASLRVGGRFRADDLAGFTHLLATSLDLEVEPLADGTLVLRKKESETR